MKNTEKLIALVGPTASGKTDLAVKLAQAIDGEIISADSRLVYRDFNIGAAKPSVEELALVPHYMIDIVSPTDNYSVNLYIIKAREIIQDIFSRNKIPIITGGTGFYVRALLEGLDIPEIKPDIEFRKQMELLILENGREFLHKKLEEVDSEMAAKLHANDYVRIIRALEVQKMSGKKMSEIQSVSDSIYNTVYIGLNAEDRAFLYDRIEKRADIMLKNGLVKEVENLIQKYGKTVSLLKTLGYKEICNYLDGMYSLEEAVEEMKKKTRNFAKRQLVWFRANKKIQWYFIDKMSNNEICKDIYERI